MKRAAIITQTYGQPIQYPPNGPTEKVYVALLNCLEVAQQSPVSEDDALFLLEHLGLIEVQKKEPTNPLEKLRRLVKLV